MSTMDNVDAIRMLRVLRTGALIQQHALTGLERAAKESELHELVEQVVHAENDAETLAETLERCIELLGGDDDEDEDEDGVLDGT